MSATLTAITNGHKQSQIDDLLTWSTRSMSRIDGQMR